MTLILKEIPVFSLIFVVFKYLFFIKFLDKTLRYKRFKLVTEILCVSLMIVLSCMSIYYMYLGKFGTWLPNMLFLIFCLVYSFIFYPNSLAEGIILSLIYNIFFVFINYICNSIEILINLSNPIWDYVFTGVNLFIAYVVITKWMTKAIDYKEYTISPKEFWLLMVFGFTGVLSIIFVNIFSQIIGIICSFGITALSYEFKLIKRIEKEKQGLIEKNEFLTEQDKMVRAVSDEKYMDKLVIV